MSASASGITSTIAGSSKHTHVVRNDDKFTPIQKQIISALSISPGLLQPDKGDIRMSYAKYTAIREAINKLHTMKLAGTWTEKVPTLQDISGIFLSKSAYFENHHRIFPSVHYYAPMKKWLSNADDAPEDVEVWGNFRRTFANLEKILKNNGAPAKNFVKRGDKKLNKGKKKATSSEEEEEVVGKGKSKAKEKSKKKGKKSGGSQKKASSNQNEDSD